jgi:hypothetical protein
VCVLAAFSGFLVFAVSSSPRTHGVVVAVQDLATCARMRRVDLAIAQAHLADPQAQVFVPAEAVDAIDGQELLAPLAAQQFLARAQLTTAHRPTLQPGFVRVTVPVRPETRVGGALRSGDLVKMALSSGSASRVTYFVTCLPGPANSLAARPADDSMRAERSKSQSPDPRSEYAMAVACDADDLL